MPFASLKPERIKLIPILANMAAASTFPKREARTGKPNAGKPNMFTKAEAGAVRYHKNDTLDRLVGIVPVSVGFIT